MPELPEVEILVRHLRPRLSGREVRTVTVLRGKAVLPWAPGRFVSAVVGMRVRGVGRRGKYLRFGLEDAAGCEGGVLLGHLGMTGRMWVQPAGGQVGRHVSVVFGLGEEDWVYEDVRQFGGFRVGDEALAGLGPEPLEEGFTVEVLGRRLAGVSRAIKPWLMDQGVVAGLGNIYASEALHEAGIAPDRSAKELREDEVVRLHAAIREVLRLAIERGMSLELGFAGDGIRDGLFYYGRPAGSASAEVTEFRVYDRAGKACPRCGAPVVRSVQGGRATYHCRRCQR